MSVKILVRNLFSTTIHGITGQEIEEGYLQAGTLIRNVTCEEWGDHKVWQFQASFDEGERWSKQKSYGEPELADIPIANPVGIYIFEDVNGYHWCGDGGPLVTQSSPAKTKADATRDAIETIWGRGAEVAYVTGLGVSYDVAESLGVTIKH